MKRKISLLLSLLLAFSVILPVQGAGSADYAFEITVSDSSPEVGDTVRVELTLKSTNNEAFNICAMQNYVNFDTESFEYVEDSLSCSTEEFTATAQNGRVYVNCFGKDMDVESGSISVMTFELKVLKAGDSSITHDGTRLIDEDLTSYDFSTHDVTVEAVVSDSEDTDDDTDDTEPSVPTPDPRYDIDIIGSVKGGDVDVSKTRATKGTEITIFTDPDEDYELRYVIVLDEDGDEVRVREEGDGVYTFRMPESDVRIRVSFKKIGSTDTDDEDEETEEPVVPVDPPVHVCPSAAFTDVNTSLWYHEAIDYAVENGLMNGVSETSFDPNGTTTRAMLATILWRVAGSPVSNTEMPFSDVEAGSWYYEAVKWASATGVVNGIGEGLFAPNALITREQLATMIYRYEKHNGGGFEGEWSYTLGFVDASNVSSWAYEALSWCHKNKIVNGMGDNLLLPLGNATRAQAAQMLMNYLNLE